MTPSRVGVVPECSTIYSPSTSYFHQVYDFFFTPSLPKVKAGERCEPLYEGLPYAEARGAYDPEAARAFFLQRPLTVLSRGLTVRTTRTSCSSRGAQRGDGRRRGGDGGPLGLRPLREEHAWALVLGGSPRSGA